MTREHRSYIAPAVSRYYRFDWQYAIDIYKETSLRIVSLILFIVPLLLSDRNVVPLSFTFSLWLFWFSSVLFLLSMLIINFRCPRFIREYRDYGQYRARCHSHRWIVWEFYNNLRSLAGWKNIVEETVAKDVSYDIKRLKVKKLQAELERIFGGGESESDVMIHKPVIFNRDIYLPIRLHGQKVVLCLEEDDEKLSKKEQELFWILYSQAAKERPRARVFCWICIYASVTCAFIGVFAGVIKIASMLG